MSCSICCHPGHNAATCTDTRIEDSARLLWTMFDFVEDQAKENYSEFYGPNNLPPSRVFQNEWFLKFIKRSLKFELNDAFTGISHWKRSFPLFKNNVDASGLTLSWLDQPDDLHYINDFFRLTTEYQDYKNYRCVSKYMKMYYQLAIFVARKRLNRDYPYVSRNERNNTVQRNNRNDTADMSSPAVVSTIHSSPSSQSTVSIDLSGLEINIDSDAEDAGFIRDQAADVRQVIPESNPSSQNNELLDLTIDIPTPQSPTVNTSNPPPAPRRRRGRPSGTRQRRTVRQPTRRQPERRTRPRNELSEEELMRRLAREDPHIERRRIMKSKLTYCMEISETTYQNETDGCPICGEDMKSGNIFAIQCGHPFCGDCLGNVINKSAPSCPCCREDIQTIKFKQGIAPEHFNDLMKVIASI